jgi:CheY-like chemotaxis protein
MILWLEDRSRTAPAYELALRHSSLNHLILGTMGDVDAYLEDAPDPKDLVFIIDIMFPGVNDLSSLKIYNAPTDAGNWAGHVFVDRYLRAATSRFRQCPVLFLTERMIDDDLKEAVEALANRGAGPVTILHKYSEGDLEMFVPQLQEYLKFAASVSAPLPTGEEGIGA